VLQPATVQRRYFPRGDYRNIDLFDRGGFPARDEFDQLGDLLSRDAKCGLF